MSFYKPMATYPSLKISLKLIAQTNDIREAINKAWVLGEGLFKERIKLQLVRRLEPAARGGDRKLAHFKINRS